MRHLVIGAGEVGQALAEVLDCDIRDVELHTGRYDALHIAFPWSDRFIEHVEAYQDSHRAEHVVVHSTVPVGTCDVRGWTHSPVRGRHPHLAEGVRAFVKHFGGADAADMAKPFADVGVTTAMHEWAADTEAGKLWELAQLGIQVRVMKEIEDYCDLQGLDFDIVYRQFAETYNAGYASLGEARFTRPVLTPTPGHIGGHCVAQNSPLLADDFVRDLLEPISPPEIDWA